MLFRRKGCPKPPPAEYTDEELAKVKLPPKREVLERLNSIVKDNDIRMVMEDIINAIYSMSENSYFIKWVKNEALRYRIYVKEDKMIDYILASGLAFVAYCKDEVYNEANLMAIASGTAKIEDIKEPACIVVAELIEALKSNYTGAKISRWKLLRLARKWSKETGKIKKLWSDIEKNWCKW